MSIHIGAKPGDIAETILLPGDPLRAKYIADTYLENVVQYNNVRGMLGFTGTYKGKRLSVQGTGMGVPSISIYTHELMNDYGVQNLIRVGTCGAIQKDVHVRDVILAMSASTDSSLNRVRFNNSIDFAPTANFQLLYTAFGVAKSTGVDVKVGNIFTADTFYNEDDEAVKKWAAYGVLALEMETAALYTLAAKFGRKALTVLTVSDHVLTGEATSADEREKTLNQMIEIGLNTAAEIA